MRLRPIVLLSTAALPPSCGGSCSSPIRGPRLHAGPGGEPGATSLNTTLRAQLEPRGARRDRRIRQLGLLRPRADGGSRSSAPRSACRSSTSRARRTPPHRRDHRRLERVARGDAPTASTPTSRPRPRPVSTSWTCATPTARRRCGPGAKPSVRPLAVDRPETGLLYANGTQSGMHVLDLTADPTNPREVGVLRRLLRPRRLLRAATGYTRRRSATASWRCSTSRARRDP